MGKILEVFQDNREVIIRGLAQNFRTIIDLLQEKGVYKAEETHGLLKDKPYLVVYAIFAHVDAGGYYAEFVDALTEARVYGVAELVKLANCSFTKKLEDRNVEDIGSDITLSCCLDEEYGVRWYKDQCEIFMNDTDKFRFKDEQWKHMLIIADIQKEDSGVYSCECGTTKTSCILEVKANLLIKQLEDVTITADQKLILACELNAGCKNIKWFKANGAISFRANRTDFKIADSNAHKYKLEINHVKTEDAGEYSCQNENVITTCHVTVKEIKIDSSLKTTTLLYELGNTRNRLIVTKDEILNTRTRLDKSATDVDKKEISIKERETEIAEFRARLKEQENMLKIRESELENKENYMKELEDKNQQLTESVKSLESMKNELESTKEQSAHMQDKIAKLEGEKQDLEVRVSTLETYINEGKINEQQQKVLEDIRTMIAEQNKSKICSIS